MPQRTVSLLLVYHTTVNPHDQYKTQTRSLEDDCKWWTNRVTINELSERIEAFTTCIAHATWATVVIEKRYCWLSGICGGQSIVFTGNLLLNTPRKTSETIKTKRLICILSLLTYSAYISALRAITDIRVWSLRNLAHNYCFQVGVVNCVGVGIVVFISQVSSGCYDNDTMVSLSIDLDPWIVIWWSLCPSCVLS